MNQAETSRLYEYQYEFDDAGNRTKMKYFDGSTTTTSTYHYNDLNQMCLRCKTYQYFYTYDDNGNLTKEDLEGGSSLREFTWNDDNRMTFIDNVADSKEAEYTYDPLGRRIMRKDVDNNTYTYYYYNGLTVLAEKKKVGAGNPTWDKLFTVAPGVIGNILRSNLNYYHYDAMGNLVFISDFDGTPSQSFDQEAYGNVKIGSQSGYHLTTKEYDSSPELYYFWQRWYDPIFGRFISLDPIKSKNLYVYCSNDPINILDPQGLRDWGPLGGRCCNSSNGNEGALVNGTWILLRTGECTSFWSDCDGMTCGGGFYAVYNMERGTCRTPGADDETAVNRRWVPCGPNHRDARPPIGEDGRGARDLPPDYPWGPPGPLPRH